MDQLGTYEVSKDTGRCAGAAEVWRSELLAPANSASQYVVAQYMALKSYVGRGRSFLLF